MTLDSSLQCSQEPATRPYPELDESVHLQGRTEDGGDMFLRNIG
jgi:hypothetical protein